MTRSLPSRRRLLHLSGTTLSALLAGCSALNQSRASGTSSSAPPTETAAPVASQTNTPSPSQSSTPETPTGITTPTTQVAYGNAQFGLDLLNTIATGTDNWLISPYSVAIALAMTYAGARGDTRSQIQATLRYPFTDRQLHRSFQTIHQQLIPDDQTATTPTPTPTPTSTETATPTYDVPLRVFDANKLWGQRGYPWRDAYRSLVEQYYGAGFESVDFNTAPVTARKRINEWVATVTREEITNLLPEGSVTRMTRLVLTNAVYFQALWEYQFQPDKTKSKPFTSLDGTTTDVPMMMNKELFPYAEIDGHQLIELPYEQGRYGMVIVLPPEGTYRDFQASLTGEQLWRWLTRLENRAVRIQLPKFAFDSDNQLKSVFKEMGMAAPFTPGQADFSGMVREEESDLFIDNVYQKTSIAVDEKGTTAAAAAGVTLMVSAPPEPEVEMTVDRPFLVLIRERETGTILFLGRVVDGQTAGQS